jgi:hypothetical protein
LKSRVILITKETTKMFIYEGDVFEFRGNQEDDSQLGLYAQVQNSQFNIIDIESGNRWADAKKIINGHTVEHTKLEKLWDISIFTNTITHGEAHFNLLTSTRQVKLSLPKNWNTYTASGAIEPVKTAKSDVDTTSQTILKNIRNSKGKIFTVRFEKVDGTMRTMNCRVGVWKYVKETSKPHNNPKVITVYDLQAKDYRAFHIDRVQWAKIAGVMYYNENFGR